MGNRGTRNPEAPQDAGRRPDEAEREQAEETLASNATPAAPEPHEPDIYASQGDVERKKDERAARRR